MRYLFAGNDTNVTVCLSFVVLMLYYLLLVIYYHTRLCQAALFSSRMFVCFSITTRPLRTTRPCPVRTTRPRPLRTKRPRPVRFS